MDWLVREADGVIRSGLGWSEGKRRNSGEELKQIWKRRKDEEERKERRRRLPSLANGGCMNGGSF